MEDKQKYLEYLGALARRDWPGAAKKFSVSATVKMVLRHEVTAACETDARIIFEHEGGGDEGGEDD